MFVKRIISEIINCLKESLKSSRLKYIDKSAHFTGKKYIELGKHTMISQNTWLNVNERGGKRIVLGDYNFIGRNNFFTSGKLIEFGDFVITSVNCSFIGANHAYEDPRKPYMFSAAKSDQIIKIGDNCFIGANVTLMGDVDIGRGSLIGVNSFVRNMVVPPFSIVVGHEKPRIIKRFSFADHTWKKIEDWSAEDENAIPSCKEYKEMLKSTMVNVGCKKNDLPLKAIGKTNGDLYL